jgi:hypothetical protein
MFNLPMLKEIIDKRKAGQSFDQEKHSDILKMLNHAAKSFDLEIPKHWQ